MGDRAYAEVICRAKDVTAFEELGFGEEKYWEGPAKRSIVLGRLRSQLRQLLVPARAGRERVRLHRSA